MAHQPIKSAMFSEGFCVSYRPIHAAANSARRIWPVIENQPFDSREPPRSGGRFRPSLPQRTMKEAVIGGDGKRSLSRPMTTASHVTSPDLCSNRHGR